jgi:hypothetical protein
VVDGLFTTNNVHRSRAEEGTACNHFRLQLPYGNVKLASMMSPKDSENRKTPIARCLFMSSVNTERMSLQKSIEQPKNRLTKKL